MIRALGFVACVAIAALVHRATDEPVRTAAREFAAKLTSEQRAKAVLAYGDPERRDWHYVPRARRGIALAELDAEQTRLARALVRSALSETGARKVDEIVVLEGVLRELESNPGRDPARYYVTLFGDLDGRGTFGWRLEGHHVALNFSSPQEGRLAVTPQFLGANPARVQGGEHEGLRVLAAEEDLGRALANSFGGSHHSPAVSFRTAPPEVLYGPGRAEMESSREGIALAQMTSEQQQHFWQLVDVYIDRLRAPQAEAERARLRAIDPAELRFVWIGSVRPGDPHYYRIQGPRFAIEYDNVQGGANHVHTLWRDFERDFGDALREHHEREHSK